MRTILSFLFLILFAQNSYAGELTISNSWAAESVGKSPMGAAYMTIHNAGEEKRILQKVTGDISNVIEIHTHTTSHDGMMQMRKIEDIIIQPSKDTVFEPGGLHLMLIGLKKPLKADDTFALTLHFANGETFDTTFIVKQR